jgi:2,5-diamino-6-(ribosylamino)-4(3H)-pyrimidinone 5'-phosphate reductase
MKRPYVICHMAPSIDGRIVTSRWDVASTLSREYERTAAMLDANAWIIGRVSMEPYAGKARVPRKKNRAPVPRTDFIATRDAESYAIAIDPSGKLTWRSDAIDGEHVITILTEIVDDDYLAFLRTKGVSYLFGGKKEIDLELVLRKLAAQFRIKRLLLEGGGKINGTFLAANLIDELSILIAPVADGASGTPTLFDADETTPARKLKLIAMERRKADVVWLRYKVRPGR